MKGKKLQSSRPEVFCKKGVPRNFAKLIEKHLCQNLFFDKVAGLRLLLKLRNASIYSRTSQQIFAERGRGLNTSHISRLA